MKESRIFMGKVVSGAGNMSRKMTEGSASLDLYEKHTVSKLIPGTLNVEVDNEVDMPIYAEQITRNDPDGEVTIYIAPVLINDLACYMVRSKKTEDGFGRHSRRIVEVISDHNLREKLKLSDGDKVVLRF